MKRLSVAFALAALCLIAGPPERMAQVESRLAPRLQIEGQPPLQWTITERQKHHKTPGVSIAVIHDGNIDWTKGYGEGISTKTLFQAASISKPVAAVAALRLVADGKLNLDEDVNLKLKSWKVPLGKWGKPVTLRQLLSHTAGLTVHGFPGYAKTDTLPTMVQILKGEKPANTQNVLVDIEPGSIYRYSGGGYQVMQLLIEDVTGKPFANVVKSLVLDPAAMKDSTYDQPAANRAASGYKRTGELVTGGWHIYPEQAAAGLWTTSADLARFLMAVKASKLLPQALTKEMLTPVKDGYGLGFGMDGTGDVETFGHSGANAGFRCSAIMYKNRGDGVVVMTSGDNGNSLASEAIRAVAAVYDWPSRKPGTLKTTSLSDAQLDAFVGNYEAGDFKVQITRAGKALKASAFGQSVELVPETDVRFVSFADGTPPFVFEKDESGKATGVNAGRQKLRRVD